MKIVVDVEWDEFSKLPPGTIFQSVRPCDLGDLLILGEARDLNLISARLLPVSGYADVLSLTAADEKRFGIRDVDAVAYTPSGFSRDYGPGAGPQWLIWEQADCERLAGWLLDRK